MVSESPSVNSELPSGDVSSDSSSVDSETFSGDWSADSSSNSFELPSVEGLGEPDEDVPESLGNGEGEGE